VEPVDSAQAALSAAHRDPRTALSPGNGIVRLVAHRGAGHEHNDPDGPPENTLAAVEYGYSNGADAVEVDVWRTADGVVVLHHDHTTDRTTDRPGWEITGVTYPDLLSASAGRWKGVPWEEVGIPTLTEVARVVPPDRGLVVEVEEGPQVVPDILAATADAGLTADQVMYISKNLDTAGAVKHAAPQHRVLWIVDTTPRWQIGGWAQGHRRGLDSTRVGFDDPADVEWLVDEARQRNLDGLDTMISYPPELPGVLAETGLIWMVWTANDPRAIDACLRDGVWGITTDNTRRVRGWLEAAGIRLATRVGRHF
jgi:glycerophosphoryl diester phosphodiesterase